MSFRLPTHHEIEQVVNATGANLVAVENFLDGLDSSMPCQFHLRNLVDDAQAYHWKEATVAAIREGIKLAYRGR